MIGDRVGWALLQSLMKKRRINNAHLTLGEAIADHLAEEDEEGEAEHAPD